MQNSAIEDFIDDLAGRVKTSVQTAMTRKDEHILLEDTFKRFRNIIHFASDPEGLGLTTLWEHNRQYECLRDFYALLCPECNTPGPNPDHPWDAWGKSPSQLQDEILLECVDYSTRRYECPSCHKSMKELNLTPYNTLIANIGMRAGKTMMSAQILLWELHQDLLLENPQRTWHVAPGQTITYTTCTTKAEQAKDTVFAAVDGLYTNSPWFIKYVASLRRKAEEQRVPFDRIYVKNLTEIRFNHKEFVIENTGANSAGIAGRTRKVVLMDEIARFVQTDSRMGVDAVYDTLKASLLTLSDFGSKMICISSPMYKDDKICKLYEDAVTQKPDGVFARKYPTWEFNPKFPYDHPFIQERFREDPVAARRDYGADPPGALRPWMPDEYRIDEAIDPANIPLVHMQDYTHSIIVGKKKSDLLAKRVLHKDIAQTKRIVIACDPGHRKDSFGMILAYTKKLRTFRGFEDHIYVGASFAWEPTQKPRYEVDFTNVLDVIKEFCKHWQVDKVVYDQWQSVLFIQHLQSSGIDAEKLSLKDEDWDHLAGLFYNQQIHLLDPKNGGPGAKRLAWELKNLGVKDNGKVDHSATSSSDIAVCLARAAKVLLGPDVQQARVMDDRTSMIGKAIHFGRP